ncbi:hypothetical protein ES703_61190 [subsurface metagenome]
MLLCVVPSYDLEEVVYVCSGSSYTFPDGSTQNNITSTIMHASSLFTMHGCDSIIVTTVNVHPVFNLSETATVCSGDSYTFPDGTTQSNITSTLVYSSNLLTEEGCDSIIVTTVNVNPQYNLTETFAICSGDSYTFPDGTIEENITAPVSHTINLVAVNGCDSIVVTNVDITMIDVSVTQDGATLTANTAGADYQWIDCGDGSPVAGENGQSFYATQSGDYAVVISENGCTSTSDCYNVTAIAGIEEKRFESEIQVFPNPTQDKITINLPDHYNATISVISMQGQSVLEQSFDNGQSSIELELKDLEPGMYLIRVNAGNNTAILRILKE